MVDSSKVQKPRSRCILPEQKEIMLGFLNEHKQLVSGCSIREKRRLWMELSEKLNAVSFGVRKVWQEWQKVWYDLRWHAKTKRKRFSKDVNYPQNETLSNLIKLSANRSNNSQSERYVSKQDDGYQPACIKGVAVKLEPDEVPDVGENLTVDRFANVDPPALIWTNHNPQIKNKMGTLSNEDDLHMNEDDFDKMFMMSLLPAYKRLKPNDKLDVQVEILQCINNRLKSYSLK